MHISRRAITTGLAAVLALAALPAAAQKLLKYVYPDGRVVYSDKPVPGARLEGQVAPPPPVDPAAAAAARQRSTQQQRAVGEMEQSRQASTGADQELRSARSDYEAAQKRLAEGTEPLEGERIGTAGGSSRLNENYFARQQANQQAVAAAKARLEKAEANATPNR